MFKMMLQDVPGRNSPHNTAKMAGLRDHHFYRESVYSLSYPVIDGVAFFVFVCSSLPKSPLFYSNYA